MIPGEIVVVCVGTILVWILYQWKLHHAILQAMHEPTKPVDTENEPVDNRQITKCTDMKDKVPTYAGMTTGTMRPVKKCNKPGMDGNDFCIGEQLCYVGKQFYGCTGGCPYVLIEYTPIVEWR
jgi:hypothetical protein